LVKVSINMFGECQLINSIMKHYKLKKQIFYQMIQVNGHQEGLLQQHFYKNLLKKEQNGFI